MKAIIVDTDHGIQNGKEIECIRLAEESELPVLSEGWVWDLPMWLVKEDLLYITGEQEFRIPFVPDSCIMRVD